MRVLLDVTALMRPGLTGIGVYVAGLWRALRAADGVDLEGRWRLARFAKRAMIRRHIEGPMGPRVPLLTDINLRGYDIFHGPDFRIPRFGRYRRVVTIHDLVIHEEGLVDERFAAEGITKLRRTLLECRPDHIITVSEFTRRRLAELYPETASITTAVPLGVEADRFTVGRDDRTPPAPPCRGPFLLMVGSVEKRKNIETAIRAFELLREEVRDLGLVIAGMDGHRAEDVTAAIAASPARGAIHRLGFVDEPMLAALYRNASAFLYPSLYEGFGLPILEAMSAGVPVITSNHGAMAEAAGHAALLVAPTDAVALAEAARALLFDADRARRLVELGRERARAHTWRLCAERTLEAYRSAMSG